MLEIVARTLLDAFLVSLPFGACSVAYVLHVRRETRDAQPQVKLGSVARASGFGCTVIDPNEHQPCDH
ncbi:MAG: hypothetical protein AB202_02410 [Parcubacteria bacterium C7867-007]|nr:MAG: hypothetical protein AB202_02410 [Parcubacteria bacterium C7867-007]